MSIRLSHAAITALGLACTAGPTAAQGAAFDPLGPTFHFGDFDGDALDDLYVVDPLLGDRLLRNLGGGDFEDVTQAHGLTAGPGSLFALWLDQNHDGALDLYLGAVDGTVRLLQNADRGHFVDVTATSGLVLGGPALFAEARDVDGDDVLDLHIVTELGDELHRNDGEGRFQRIALPEHDLLVLQGVASTTTPAGPVTEATAVEGLGTATSEADTAARIAAARAQRLAWAARRRAAVLGTTAPAAGVLAPTPPIVSQGLATCPDWLDDFASNLCIRASSVPTAGMLYPLGVNLMVTPTGRVGLGTLTPEARLHVFNGPAGGVPITNAIATFESNSAASLSLRTPDGQERAVVFSGASAPLSGALVHNSAAVPDGFELRVGGLSPRLVVTATGNVGIGTTAPGNRLHVRSNGTTVATFEGDQTGGTWVDLQNTSANGRSWGILSAGSANGEGPGSLAFHDHTASATRLVIDTAGEVGIGTLTPGHRLHVVDGGQQPVHVAGSNAGGTWVNVTNTSTGGDTWNLISTGAGNSEGAGKLLFRDADTSTIALTLQPNGNVGVGTTAPADRLTVAGDARVSGTTRLNGNVHVDFGETNAGGVGGGALLFGGQFTGEGIAARKVGANPNQLDFYTAFNSRLTITNDGKVGIGRQPSTFALEVQGDACKTGGTGFWNICSDARIKTDVRTLDHALDTIGRLRLVEYRYTPEHLARSPEAVDKVYFNVIAQEYAEVFPDYVSTSDADGILKVDTYPALVHALAAIQELHVIVQERDLELRALAAEKDAEIATLEARLARLEASVAALAAAPQGR